MTGADKNVQRCETRDIDDSGFNPEWKETFKLQIRSWDAQLSL